MSRLRAAGAIVVIAGLARLAAGPGWLGYDAAWALVWGRAIAHGHAPDLTAAGAPTPHPLANLVSAVVTPLGTAGAAEAILVISWLSLGALAVGLAVLGARVFSWPVGVLAAVAVATRSLVLSETAQAVLDLPFLALIVWAAVAAWDRRDLTAAALLGLAGLLRPEGWALGLAFLVLAVPRLAGRRRAGVLVLVAAGPVLWIAMDAWAAGDPLHSLHGTQALAESLGRPRSAGTAVSLAPDYLRSALHGPLFAVALAGAAAGLLWRPRRSVLPGAALVLGVAAFLILGVTGLPLLIRYLLVPAVALALFAGLAVFGWTTAPPGRRRAWHLGGAVAAVVILIGVPADIRAIRNVHAFDDARHAIQRELLAAAGGVARHHCAVVSAGDPRAAPLLALRLDLPPGDIVAGGRRRAGSLLAFAFADQATARAYTLAGTNLRWGPLALPARARRLHTGPHWLVAARGC